MALEVEGSNPFTHPIFLLERTAISCIILFRCYGPVAQLAEQGTLNPKVQGSNPCRSTMKHEVSGLSGRWLFLFVGVAGANRTHLGHIRLRPCRHLRAGKLLRSDGRFPM